MDVILFEDDKLSNFFPISRLRTVDNIRTGKWTQKERALLQFKSKVLSCSTRDSYGDIIQGKDEYLFLNSRLKDFNFFGNLESKTCVINKDGDMLGYKGDRVIEGEAFDGYKVITKEIPLYNFIWDVIADLPDRLRADMENDPSLGQVLSPIGDFVSIENKNNVYIGKDVKLGAYTVLDAEDGPIWIDDGVVVESHCCVKGPSFIGRGSKIKPDTLLEVVSFGDVVKASGEIEESIFQGYSNKQHLGFLGHAFIGEWVNLGAGTTNSDLKNNYSKVNVILEGKRYETGMQFLGTIIGDHSKAAINTTFNTGTIVEPFCNIFGKGFPPRYVPPFSWCSDDIEEYKFDKAIQTAIKVMSRRNVDLDEDYRKKAEELFLESKNLRNNVK